MATSRLISVAVCCVASVSLWLVAAAGTADAADTSDVSAVSGWWTSLPAAAVPVAGADVPTHGLLIQGGASAAAPTAYAAVRFESLSMDQAALQSRVRNITLTLSGGPSLASATSVQLCPLTKAFSATYGGGSQSGPSWDCTHWALATPTPDGQHLRATVTGLGLAFAVLPTSATERIVVAPVDGSTLGLETVTTTSSASQSQVAVPTASAKAMPGPAPNGAAIVPLSLPAPQQSLALPGPVVAPQPQASAVPALVRAAVVRTQHPIPMVWLAMIAALVMLALWRLAGADDALHDADFLDVGDDTTA